MSYFYFPDSRYRISSEIFKGENLSFHKEGLLGIISRSIPENLDEMYRLLMYRKYFLGSK